jgi:hypothetical protein
MLSFKNENVPANVEITLKGWLDRQFRNIYKAAHASVDYVYMRTQNTSPARTNDGEVRIADGANWNPRFGYGMYFYSNADVDWRGVVAVGAGGTVTQQTNKTTSVTLNNSTGQITMNNAALASQAVATFTLTNSTINAGDVLVMNHISGGTAGSYSLNAQSAAGSASINVTNVSAGSLSEAIVIAFTRIPGATA